MSILANKVALVTGGSRGIGAAIAKRLAAGGANVAFTYAKLTLSAASAVVEGEIELARAAKRLRSMRTLPLPTSKQSKGRSTRPSRPSADSTCW